MTIKNHLRTLYLSHLSSPASDRPIYRASYRRQLRTIVELGIGTARRAIRMIELAALGSSAASEVHYTGIDLFEARTAADGPGLSLKTAHRLMQATGARIQLVPGDPLSALARAANGLGPTDLVVISYCQDPEPLAHAWFYLPRLLHPGSVVYAERPLAAGGLAVQVVPAREIEQLAAGAASRRAA